MEITIKIDGRQKNKLWGVLDSINQGFTNEQVGTVGEKFISDSMKAIMEEQECLNVEVKKFEDSRNE